MEAIYSVMEKREIMIHGSGESIVLAPEIKLPFNISGGQAPLPESGPILISRNGSMKEKAVIFIKNLNKRRYWWSLGGPAGLEPVHCSLWRWKAIFPADVCASPERRSSLWRWNDFREGLQHAALSECDQAWVGRSCKPHDVENAEIMVKAAEIWSMCD